jgi:hypothetical protein
MKDKHANRSRVAVRPTPGVTPGQARDVRARALRYALDCYFRKQQTSGASSENTTVTEQSDYSWYYSPASVAVSAHIITPAPIYLDRGKTRLNMEGA